MLSWRTIAPRLRFAGVLAGVLGLWSCADYSTDERPQTAAGPIVGPAGRIHVRDEGTGGVPVVFLHSFAGSGEHWSEQMSHLRPSRRVVAIDLRGHGGSEAPASGNYAADSLAADVAAAVDALGLEHFVLVGHSMGGSAAIAYAGAHPDRVAGLVLVGTPGRSSPEQAKQVMSSMEADYDKVSQGYWEKLLESGRPEVQSKVRGQMNSVPREASLRIFRSIFEYDPLPALTAYSGPKLLVDTPHGESPGALHNLSPGVPRKVIEGTSHWPHLDKPDEFNAILDEFLGTVS